MFSSEGNCLNRIGSEEKSSNPPLKTNIAMEPTPFEDALPSENEDFPVAKCLFFFGGVVFEEKVGHWQMSMALLKAMLEKNLQFLNWFVLIFL